MGTPFKKAGDVRGLSRRFERNFVQTNPVLLQVGFAQGGSGPTGRRASMSGRANAIDFASPSYFGGLAVPDAVFAGNPSETSILPTRRAIRGFVSQALKWEGARVLRGDAGDALRPVRGFQPVSSSAHASVDPVAGTITPVRLASVMRNSKTRT